jgi:O-antigen/teichoic acid export membrane protein
MADLDGGPHVEPQSHDEMSSRHLRGSSLLLIGRLASLAFTIATQVVLVRALSKSDYGAVAFALAMSTAMRFLLSLGQGKSLSRFLALYLEERDYGRLFGSVLLAVATILATSTLLITVLYLFQDTLIGDAEGGTTAGETLLIVVFLAPMEALDQIFVSVFAVLTKPGAIFFRKYVFTPGLRLGVVLLLAFLGSGPTFLAAGYVAASVAGIVLYVTMLRRVLRQRGLLQHLHLGSLTWPVRSIFSFAIPMLSTELVYLSTNTGSVLLLTHFFGTVGVANYRAVFPAAGLNNLMYTTFLTLYLPMASRLFARGEHAAVRADYWRTAAFLALFAYPIFAMTGPFAPATTVFLFGERYREAGPVLALLSTGYYVSCALGFNMVTLQAYGRVRYLLGVNVFAALLNLALGLVLVPRAGAKGAAVAYCATLVVQNAMFQVGLRRVTGSPLLDMRYAPVYLSVALTSAALWGIELAWGPPFVVCVLIAGAFSIVQVVINRRLLDLAASFPELRRIPLLRNLLV